ncbi:unnamed protein product [Protopolystoma xenopodis]|uniref:Uncharacterized protein n=1 Tax=Protopolystoma xenopodis TaxID=117903 RepID=A0A3S5FC44_9PLAT|nr:unnamed protein product [Protopolystoma xenopodis]
MRTKHSRVSSHSDRSDDYIAAPDTEAHEVQSLFSPARILRGRSVTRNNNISNWTFEAGSSSVATVSCRLPPPSPRRRSPASGRGSSRMTTVLPSSGTRALCGTRIPRPILSDQSPQRGDRQCRQQTPLADTEPQQTRSKAEAIHCQSVTLHAKTRNSVSKQKLTSITTKCQPISTPVRDLIFLTFIQPSQTRRDLQVTLSNDYFSSNKYVLKV